MEIMDASAAQPLLGISEEETTLRERAALLKSVEFQATLQKAAFLVDQALLRRWMPLEVLQHKNYQKAKLCWSWYNRLFYVRCVVLGIMIILPFFQAPEWCTGTAGRPCGDPDRYMLSGINYIRPSVALAIEALCVFPLIVSLLLQRYYKFQTFWHHGSTYVKVGLCIIISVRIFAAAANLPWMFFYQGTMANMYLNILTPIFFSSSLRGCFRMTLQIVHSFLDTAILLAGFILLSAWLANVLFREPNFEDYPTSLLSLLIMLTTANNPNVWAEVYTNNRISFIFFFVYMLVGFFFLMHLLFALIYNNYKVQLAVEVHKHATIRQNNLRAAFDLLNLNRDGITIPTATALFNEIGSYRHISDVDSTVQKVFARRNRSPDDKIIFGDFQMLCDQFLREVDRKAEARFLEEDNEVTSIRMSCTTILIESNFYKCFSWAVTLASLVAAVLDRSIRGVDFTAPRGISLSLLTTWEYAFGMFFFVEMSMKLRVLGSNYWDSLRNCYDTLLTFSIVGVEILSNWHPEVVEWISLLLIIRSLRIVSLLNHFTRWRLMFCLLVRMVPATAPILGIQYCVCSLFAILGVHLFGGLVYVGNPLLEGTEYAASGLWVYNYNDYGSAMVSSFNLCVVNNWYVIMDGIVAASGTSWARAYFITFWAISVTFTLNVVVAFFVGAFTTQLEKAENDRSMVVPQNSKYAVLTRKKVGFSLFMGYSRTFSKYDLYEEIVKR
ncbi:protein MpTPC2 [Marchantia polymorpha subsp. ruderalis]